MQNAILIYSGGLDSTTMLYEYRDKLACAVSFDYGSKHNRKEIDCARYHCNRLAIEHLVIPLDFIGKYFHSALLLNQGDIPEGVYDTTNIQSTVVPFRNGIMLSIAAGLAQSRNMSCVMIANHAGDHAIYPDCTPSFIDAMNEAIKNGTDSKVSLFAPYTTLSKADIARRGKQLNIDYSKTWSCYKGGQQHCGKCATCLERKDALLKAGIADTTIYEK